MINVDERFSRAIGIVSPRQLLEIQGKRVAIAGLGMGGSIFLNLVRLGYSDFHIADPDVYERTNINRQRLARESTVTYRKDDCLVAEALDVNPKAKIRTFPQGVNSGSIGEFLSGVDWVVDVVDIYAMEEKLRLHTECGKRGIPVVSAACIGFGASMVIFSRREQPTFAELSGIALSQSRQEQLERFVDFITPEVPEYMREQLSLSLAGKSHVPFVVTSVEFAGAAVAAEITKHLLGLGRKITAPQGIYIDPMQLKFEVFDASVEHRRSQREKLGLRAA